MIRLKRFKPNKVKFKVAITYFLIILIASPLMAIFFTFFSPSVSESTNPSLGECDIVFKGNYIPCMTIGEAMKINLFLICSIAVFAFIIILFAPEDWVVDTKGDTK
jgi:hypothetical protein